MVHDEDFPGREMAEPAPALWDPDGGGGRGVGGNKATGRDREEAMFWSSSF